MAGTVTGYLKINKPRGMTSHDVVNRVRRLYGLKKVGHTGTLDPDADGLMIEVHNDPAKALCDGAQSIKPDMFTTLMQELKGIAQIVGREI